MPATRKDNSTGKAMIKILNGSKKNTTIEVLYYPSTYTLTGTSSFTSKEVPGRKDPLIQFTGGSDSSLSMELIFDTYEKRQDVRQYTTKITDLLIPDSDLHEPPLFEFLWGPMPLGIACVMKSVTQNFLMFLETGIPVRAKLNVTISPRKSVTEQLQEASPQSSDRTKQRTLNQGEQLWMLADEEYHDPGLWRSIARANKIDNPRLPEHGKLMIVPRLEG